MKRSASKRPPWSVIWKTAANWSTRRAMFGLWCWRYHGIPARNLLRRFLLPPTPTLDLRLSDPHDLSLRLRRNDRGDHASFFENFFELPVGRDLCPEPAVIADAGAHVGCFALRAHSLWPRARVVAFEPDTANVELLKQNFALNQVPGQVVAKALWKEPARLEFIPGQSNSGFLSAGTKPTEATPPATPRQVEVEGTSLSAHFGSELSEVDLVKLDIEGAELEVLEAELPRLSKNTTILCELHFTDRHRQRFETLLTKHGWRCQLFDASHPPHSTWIIRRGGHLEAHLG